MGRKNMWLLGASALLWSAPTLAQDTAGTTEADSSGEIVVTARRKLAITAAELVISTRNVPVQKK